MGDVRVFATKGRVDMTKNVVTDGLTTNQDVPEPTTLMTRMRDPLARFIYVVIPLAEIYHLPMTSLHIFYDMAGGLIAFNRNGSVFLNLRYFEAWREYFLFRWTTALMMHSLQTTRK